MNHDHRVSHTRWKLEIRVVPSQIHVHHSCHVDIHMYINHAADAEGAKNVGSIAELLSICPVTPMHVAHDAARVRMCLCMCVWMYSCV